MADAKEGKVASVGLRIETKNGEPIMRFFGGRWRMSSDEF